MPFPSDQALLLIPSLADLAEFAQALASWLRPGDLVTLDGPLGAGKTTLTQQLLRALGVQESVSSPTFVLMNEYRSALGPVVHVDLYRLGPERAETLGQELITIADEGLSLMVVEWACYGSFLEPMATVRLQIQPLDTPCEEPSDSSRRISVVASRPLPDVLARWKDPKKS